MRPEGQTRRSQQSFVPILRMRLKTATTYVMYCTNTRECNHVATKFIRISDPETGFEPANTMKQELTTTLHYSTLQYTLQYPTLHYTTPHYTILPYTTLPHPTLHYPNLHYPTLHHPTLHYPNLHYPTLHHTTLHYTTPPHITLP